MNETLADLRRILRLGVLPERCETCGREGAFQAHHVGGRRYGGIPIRLCVPCHTEATRRQGPYAHLLNLPDPEPWMIAMVFRLDLMALAEMIAERGRLHSDLLARHALSGRERVRDDLAPRLCDPAIREYLRRRRRKGA